MKFTNRPSSRAEELLDRYIHYVSEDGIDLPRFVEQGGRLLGRGEFSGLAAGGGNLRDKIDHLRKKHPRLGRQLEFLANFFETAGALTPETVRHETAFALLYAEKDLDMIPDETPGIGYLDDTAIVETVLARHAEVFEQHCVAWKHDWASIKPGRAA